MKYLKDYIQESLSQGNYFVTKEQALASLDISPEKFRFQAYRLILKKVIRPLTRDFFMIITPEYQNLGGVPPHWVIDPLMKHLNQDYYVALLTAASMYGATNQQPMCFQVITTKPRSTIELERGSIQFHVFKQCSMSVKEKISSPAGYSMISSKEQT